MSEIRKISDHDQNPMGSDMTEPIVCHNGRCRYKHKKRSVDDCVDCDIVEQIENDLLKENLR